MVNEYDVPAVSPLIVSILPDNDVFEYPVTVYDERLPEDGVRVIEIELVVALENEDDKLGAARVVPDVVEPCRYPLI